MTLIKHFALTLALTLCGLSAIAEAQTAQLSTVNVTSDGERMRIAAQGDVYEMRVDVADEQGDVVFQSGAITGNQLDWKMTDAQGERVAAGTYLVTVTFRTASGKLRKRVEQVTVDEAEKTSTKETAAPEAVQATVMTKVPTTGGKIPKFAGTAANASLITNSIITESGGNIGIGAAPQAPWRLDVTGAARAKPHAAGDIRLSTPNTETGISIVRNKTDTTPVGRADVRFNGKILTLAAGAGTVVPANTGIVLTTSGNVGIGTASPGAWKLQVNADGSLNGLLVSSDNRA